MTEQEIFVLADQTLNDVVAKIADGQWDMRMPATFARRASGEPPTLRQIINYHAYDDSWVPDMLAGKSMDEAGHDNFKGDPLGAEPKKAFAAIVDKACAAARDLKDLDRMVHTSRRLPGTLVPDSDHELSRHARTRHREGDQVGSDPAG